MSMQIKSSDNSVQVVQESSCSWDLSIPTQNNSVVYGGIVSWIQNYDFNISEAGYYINGAFYTSPETNVTLSPSDPLLDRIDAFVVDDTGTAFVIEGTPSLTPTLPAISQGSQLLLSFIVVKAGSTQPDIEVECIYEDGSEWTPLSNSATIDVLSAIDPCSGTYHINGTNVISGDSAKLTRYAAVDLSLDFTILTMQLKSKTEWATNLNSEIILQFSLAGNPIGAEVVINNGQYGFDATDVMSCQIVSLPLTQFGIPSGDTVDELIIKVNDLDGGVSGWKIDHICMQGIPTPPVTPDIDEKVKVSPNDTNTGYLINKVIGGDGIIVEEVNDGGNEKLKIIAQNDNNLLSYGGIVTWVSGYTFHVTAAGYYINGAFYESPETDITLDPADATFNRFDVIYVDTSSTVQFITGTPSAIPSRPGLDLGTQLELGIVLVEAGTTEPSYITQECIYQENGEWTITSSGTIDPNSTNSPCIGTVSVEATASANGDNVRFIRGTSFNPATNHNIITFELKPKADWDDNISNSLNVTFRLAGVVVGNIINISNGSYNFDYTDVGVCQTISIPIEDFGLLTTDLVDEFRIETLTGTTFGWFVDGLCLQGGIFQNFNFTDTDEKVKVSWNDDESGYLADKIVSGSGISIQQLNDGDVETLMISSTNTSNSLAYGGVVTWLQNYDFNVTAAGYYINNTFYQSPDTVVTLSASDPTYDRFDVIYVDTTGTVNVLEGTPSATPSQPGLDLGSQLGLGVIYVEAGSTQPNGINQECLYLENTEWTATSSSVRININSTNSPCIGSKNIEASLALNGDYFKLVTTPAFALYPDYDTLTFVIRSKGAWGTRSLSLRWYNSNSPVGTAVTVSHNNQYSFISTDTVNCQIVSIRLTDFNVPVSQVIDELRITSSSTSGSFGWYMDGICLQGVPGLNPPIPDDIHNQFFGAQPNASFWIEKNARVDGYISSPGTVGSEKFGFMSTATLGGNSFGWKANSDFGVSIGTLSSSQNSVSIGNYVSTISTSVGILCSSTGTGAIAIAPGGTNTAGSTINIGAQSSVTSTGAIAIGYFANTAGAYSTGLGLVANVAHNYSIGIGAYATSTGANQLILGGTDNNTHFGVKEMYIGIGKAHALADNVFMTITSASGTNTAAKNLTIAAARGTGNSNSSTSGKIIFQTSDAGSSGTTLQTLTNKLEILKSGQLKANKYGVNTFAGTAAYLLGVDSSGNIIETTGGGGGTITTADNGLTANTSTNVQLGGTIGSPATLLHDSYIDGGIYILDITSTSAGQTFYVGNTSNGAAIQANAVNGVGITSYSTNNEALFVRSDGYYAGEFSARSGTTPTTVIPNILISSSGTNGLGGNGVGASIDYSLGTSITPEIANTLVSKWTDATHATRTSQFIITGVNSGTTGDIAYFNGSGMVGIGSSTASATRLNIVDDVLDADGIMVNITSASTTSSGAGHRGLNVELSGINVNSGQNTYSIYSTNSHSDSSGTNYAGFFNATNGFYNYGIYSVASGGISNIGVHGGGSNYGVEGVSANIGVRGDGTAQGVYGTGQSGVIGYGTIQGVLGISTTASGIGLSGQTLEGTPGYLSGQWNSNNTVETILQLNRSINSSPEIPVAGVGGAIEFLAPIDENPVYPHYRSNRIISKWTDITSATRKSQFIITGVNNGLEGDILTLNSDKSILANGYGLGNFVGTAAYTLQVDSSGNIIEGAASISAITANNGLTASTSTNTQLGSTSNSGSPLLHDSYINTDAYSLIVNTGTASVIPLQVQSTSGTAIYAYSTLGTGLSAYSGTAIALQSQSDGGSYSADFRTYSSGSNNTVLPIVKILALNGSAPSANGFGASIDYTLMTTNFGTTRVSNQLISKWTTATDASRVSQFVISGVNAGVSGDIANFHGTGVVGIGRSSGFIATRLDVVDNSLANDTIINVSTTSTAAFANAQRLLNMSLSGANSNSGQTTYGIYLLNAHTGTTSTNVGAFLASSSGTNNYALIVPSTGGSVGIGTETPSASKLEIVDNSVAGNSIVSITSTSTAAASNAQKGLNISLSGANSTSTQSTYGAYFSNTHTGTTSTNYGAYFSASGAAVNYGAFFTASSNTSYGIYSQTATGYPVYAEAQNGATAAVNAYAGHSSNTAHGLWATARSGYAVIAQMNSSSNTVVSNINVLVAGSANPIAAGLGGSIDFKIYNTNLSQILSNKLTSEWVTATAGSETSKATFAGINSGTANDIIYFEGDKRTRFNGRSQYQQGAAVASANNLVLGYDGNVFEITGTTQINLISNTDWQDGSVIYLHFTSTPTVKNGQTTSGANTKILLSGAADFVATADDTLVLQISTVGGVRAWRQIGGSVN